MPFIKRLYDLRDQSDLSQFQSVAFQHGLADGRKGIPSLTPSDEVLEAHAQQRELALAQKTLIVVGSMPTLTIYWQRYQEGWRIGRRDAEQEGARGEDQASH